MDAQNKAVKILVVDDERAVREALRRALELEGYEIELAADGQEALYRLESEAQPDALVLDVLMPGVDGLEVARTIRRAGNRVPILMLTARTQVEDRVEGLDAGADDYLTKPFALEELLARLRALLRRTAEGSGEVLRFADLELDPGTREVKRGGELDLVAFELQRAAERLAHRAFVVYHENLHGLILRAQLRSSLRATSVLTLFLAAFQHGLRRDW